MPEILHSQINSFILISKFLQKIVPAKSWYFGNIHYTLSLVITNFFLIYFSSVFSNNWLAFFIHFANNFWLNIDYNVRKLYLPELSLIQMSELNNRLTMRNTDQTISQIIYANWSQMLTIWYPHRCVSLPTLLWMLIDAIVGFDQRTHTHARSLSVSPLPCSLSPSFRFT